MRPFIQTGISTDEGFIIESNGELSSDELDKLKSDVENGVPKVAEPIRNYLQLAAPKICKGAIPIQDFCQLAWHQRNGERIVSPNHEERTVRAVVQRAIDRGGLGALSKHIGKDREEHDPEYFKDCLNIYNDLDMEKFGHIWLVDAVDCEKMNNTNVKFYIYDGNHRSLAVAFVIRSGKYQDKAIPYYYIKDRGVLEECE